MCSSTGSVVTFISGFYCAFTWYPSNLSGHTEQFVILMSTSLVVSKHIAVTYHWHGRLLGSVNNTLAHSTHTLVLIAHLHTVLTLRHLHKTTSCQLVLMHTLPHVHLNMLALGTQRLLHTRTQSGALHTLIPWPTLPRSHFSTLYVHVHTRWHICHLAHLAHWPHTHRCFCSAPHH